MALQACRKSTPSEIRGNPELEYFAETVFAAQPVFADGAEQQLVPVIRRFHGSITEAAHNCADTPACRRIFEDPGTGIVVVNEAGDLSPVLGDFLGSFVSECKGHALIFTVD